MIERCNIDWIHVVVPVKHDPYKLSTGITINVGNDLDFDSATHHFKPRIIKNSCGNTLWIKSSTENSIEISGNVFKFLNQHNVNGSNNLIGLVKEIVLYLQSIDIGVYPDSSDFNNIDKGNFRLFRVDVNKPLFFLTKNEALEYLRFLKKQASYPYRKKEVFENGVYFGMKSKRWVLKFYHKGSEVNKNGNLDDTNELKALADLMIRAEISIKSRQLNEWDLKFGYQWESSDVPEKLMQNIVSKLILPNREEDINEIKTPSHKRFYKACLNGDMESDYSLRTIQRYKKTFLTNYGININNLINKENI